MSRYMDSLQSLRYPSNLQLPNPTTYYEKTSKLHSRYPRAIIGIAVVIFIFFWKDIIASSWSHISNTRTAGIAVVADGNPILNSTLGVRMLSNAFTKIRDCMLICMTVPRYLSPFPSRSWRPQSPLACRCQCHQPDDNHTGRHQRQTNTTGRLPQMVGNEWMGGQRGRAGLPDVPPANMEEVSDPPFHLPR